jgi:transcriptional regulator
MYTPASFRLDDPKTIELVIEQNPFATLVAVGPNGLEASPLPLLLDVRHETDPRGRSVERREIVGHLAKQNPLAKLLASGAEALAIFQGPHAYVSPRWYRDPINVPTWNYVHVHVTGIATTFTDEASLVAFLHKLVDRFERGAKEPWRFDLPADFVADLAKAIVGFRIPMTKVVGKAKLSQNREAADAEGALLGLEASSDALSREVAAWMRSVGVGVR